MDIELDDSELFIFAVSDVCSLCEHHNFGEIRKCKAFQEIPIEIWEGKHNHKTPYPGDNGIQFEEKEKTV